MNDLRGWLFLVLGLTCWCACGEPPRAALSLAVHRGDGLLWTPTNMEIRVYGSGGVCQVLTEAVLAHTLDNQQCAATDLESGACFIVRTTTGYVANGEPAHLEVPVGDRAVLVIGTHSLYGLSAVGCSRATIEEGKTTRLDVVLDDANL